MAAARLGLPQLMLAMLALVALLGVGVDGRSHVHKKLPRAGGSSRHSRVGANVGTVASSPAVPPDDDATPPPPPGGIVPSDPATPFQPEPCVFDVRAYGATGESTADDTEAFRAAWRAACAVESAVLLVPSDGTFTISTTTFSGPCKPGLVFQVRTYTLELYQNHTRGWAIYSYQLLTPHKLSVDDDIDRRGAWVSDYQWEARLDEEVSAIVGEAGCAVLRGLDAGEPWTRRLAGGHG